MSTSNKTVWLAAIALTVIGALSVASAEAALPKKGAVYNGRTSQGFPLRVAISSRTSRRIIFVEDDLRTNCGKLGASRLYAVQFDIRVGRDGRFSRTVFGADDMIELGDDGRPVVIDGNQRRVFDVTNEQLSGRFVTSRRVTGSWRMRSAILDRNSFPENVEVLDKCDTGVVTWSARRR